MRLPRSVARELAWIFGVEVDLLEYYVARVSSTSEWNRKSTPTINLQLTSTFTCYRY